MNNSPLSRLADKYLAALRTHLEQGPEVNLQAACEIGREAVAIGQETLDLARIHTQALTQLLVPDDSSAGWTDSTARAAAFFTEAITPIEETHRAALAAATDLGQLHARLDQLSLELADANDALQRQVAERFGAETALRHSQQSSDQLLKDSRALEQQVQDMTHQILSATESERQKMSQQLNDEIAQILLAIHVRILALQKEVAAKHADFTQEIATTRRFVADSAKIISRLAHEINIQQER
ncbi:MAG: hypothetical protein NTW21_08000 [Verrucomicrobia bacterium]|nr:hypothetical protein [Verrucomicrobiota bacterium]